MASSGEHCSPDTTTCIFDEERCRHLDESLMTENHEQPLPWPLWSGPLPPPGRVGRLPVPPPLWPVEDSDSSSESSVEQLPKRTNRKTKSTATARAKAESTGEQIYKRKTRKTKSTATARAKAESAGEHLHKRKIRETKATARAKTESAGVTSGRTKSKGKQDLPKPNIKYKVTKKSMDCMLDVMKQMNTMDGDLTELIAQSKLNLKQASKKKGHKKKNKKQNKHKKRNRIEMRKQEIANVGDKKKQKKKRGAK